MLKPVYVEATTIPDAWSQAIWNCIRHGRTFTIDRGSYEGSKRHEFDYFTVHIQKPWITPFEPELPERLQHTDIPPPVAKGYINGYLPYLMTGNKEPNEEYTYGQRLNSFPITDEGIYQYALRKNVESKSEFVRCDKEIWNNKEIVSSKLTETTMEFFLNQVEFMIWNYKKYGHRDNQMVLQIAHPNDMLWQNPPCLRHIDTRIQDNALHFMPYFRSWDLWGGFPANLAAIELLKQYCALKIGVENGEIVASSKGLHIYKHTFELGEAISNCTIEEFIA
jgi:thymidylate synthase